MHPSLDELSLFDVSGERGTRDVRVRQLRGGLVSPSVQALQARYRDERGRCRVRRCVVKELTGPARREAAIYAALAQTTLRPMAPRLLGTRPGEAGNIRLYLEELVTREPWPWRDVRVAASVLEALARLHELEAPELLRHVIEWDYDAELRERAAQLLGLLEGSRTWLRAAGVDVRLGELRRFVDQLPAVRARLASDTALPPTVLHGDLHPGNVILRGRSAHPRPVLFDWERARVGSPLEDVSSWLQSLGFYEPEARRRHDTLLGIYLQSRGLARLPSREVRRSYWLAAGSNCLAGSLLYHVARAGDASLAAEERAAALRAARDQLRILRRACACLG